MDVTASAELADLLEARDASAAEEAWGALLRRHSRLILHAVRRTHGGYDGTMDRYAYVLEQLRSNDYRRLRSFEAGHGARFSTWLVVIAQRLAVDFHRRRFGRATSTSEAPSEHADIRRRLAELVSDQADLTQLPDPSALDPQAAMIRAERGEALDSAVGALSSRDRLLLSLKFVDDASAAQIAAAMGFPTQFHVYRRIKKILKELHGSLGGDDFRDRFG
jgi:RNA polymerase sigma-70 factor (ECF subfamily)